ncbi:MAG: amylo-alpha-1,6-glucosidase, partial [Planctomycetota bacterium]
ASLLLPALEELVEVYTAGTRFGMGVDPADGLVTAGDANTQLTWMDARYEGKAFTPRHGKAVEINALWYHALRCLGRDEEAARVCNSFQRLFWRADGRGLFDVITEGKADKCIRPNQIFAVSLEHSPLDAQQQATVVDTVRRELLTPFGLRTLSRDHDKFQKRYSGTVEERDGAYHNGTVWPWLMGAFLDAHLRINKNSPAARDRARTWLTPIVQHLRTGGCFGSVSEVFDATFPYRPGGCFAQAWSVAEVFRLAVELEM